MDKTIKKILNNIETPDESYKDIETTMYDDEDKKDVDVPSCWSNLKNDEYAPAYPTVPKVRHK